MSRWIDSEVIPLTIAAKQNLFDKTILLSAGVLGRPVGDTHHRHECSDSVHQQTR
jgi:hypothetical protein